MSDPIGIIFDIDHFAVHDGPGIRAVVYFKGCPLRCIWCHSPESQCGDPEPLHITSRCLSCAVCADENCPNGAYEVCGRVCTVSELLAELLADRVFYESSGGGVTLSGGEALYQPEFAAALLESLHAEGIHTVVETSAVCSFGVLEKISPSVDVFYCDIKLMDPERHRQYTGADNRAILSNITRLAALRRGQGIVLRVPLIPGYTDAAADVAEINRFAHEIGVTEVHLLPYNASAPAKYEWLSREFLPGALERQSSAYLNELVSAAPEGVKVVIM